MPWIIMPPIIIAITALDGMPSVSIGMNEVCAAALLAASGPATPSIAPLPKRSGVARHLLLERVGRKGREHRAAAGQDAERRSPSAGAAQDGGHRWPCRSAQVGISPVTFAVTRSRRSGLVRLAMISAMPNRPMAIGTKPMPSNRIADAERVAQVAGVDVGADKPKQHPERRPCRAPSSPSRVPGRPR